jgi:hypothetical protein
MTRFLLLAVFTLGVTAAEAAPKVPTDAKVDCAVFTKRSNGVWFATRQTMIELSGSKINLPAGDIEARMLQYGMADLHNVLETACPDQKSESPRPGSVIDTIR